MSSVRRYVCVLMLAIASLVAMIPPASSQPATPTSAPPPAVPPGTEEPTQYLFERSSLLGDLGGVRTSLSDWGITFGLQETSEILGNPSGGQRRGNVYEGLTQISLGVDLGKAIGLTGGTFNVSAFQIHGRGLSQNALNNNLQTVSSIEALRGTLLFELWYEQLLFDQKIGIRIGQQSADQEFMISQYAGLFVNHTFGWSTFPSADLPSGGPSYPLGTPAIRVRATLTDQATALVGIYNGDPAGPGTGNPQLRDASGTAFRLRDGVFVISELQYAVNQGDSSAGFPGTYRFGGYYNSQPLADLRRDTAGLSLADPRSTGIARTRRGNFALYAVADQMVWRRDGAKDQGVGVFVRVMGGPGDRNLINFYADAGVTFKGVLSERPNDTVGLAVSYARISDTASKLDSDRALIQRGFYLIRRNETVLELTYQAQLAPWWQLQPDFQYIFNLGGGTLNPQNPGRKLGDASIIGLRTVITF